MGQDVQALYRWRLEKKFCLQINLKFSFTEIVDDFMSDAEVMKEC